MVGGIIHVVGLLQSSVLWGLVVLHIMMFVKSMSLVVWLGITFWFVGGRALEVMVEGFGDIFV